jgi:hypothetical protein
MSYQVKPGEGEITVHTGQAQTIQFTVNNTSDRPILTQTEVRVGGAVELKWCSVEPEADTNLEAKGSRTYTVTVAPTGVTKPTSGHVQLAAASVDDPSHATPSPTVRVTILPAESAPTWWQRHGKQVLIGAAILLVAAVAGILVFSGGLEIEEFKATPAGGAPAGEEIVLEWEISGTPSAVYLAQGTGERTLLPEAQWKAGPSAFTALTPGPLEIRLTVSDGDDDSRMEVSKRLDLMITESVRTFAPPVITSFAVTPLTVESGQPVRFDWTTTGDVVMLSLDFGNSAPPTITDPERIAAGSLELPLLPGTYRAVATAVGKDNSRVASEAVEFVVTERPSQQLPEVTLSATATGRSRGGLAAANRPAPNLTVQWNVVGEHTGLQVSYLARGTTPSAHDLAGASGNQTFRNAFVPEGAVVQLFVGQRTGPRLVYECTVGGPPRVLAPAEFEVREGLLDRSSGVLGSERVIHTMKPRELIRAGGG